MMFIALVRRSVARHRTLAIAMGVLLSAFQVLLVAIAASLQRQGLYSQVAALIPPFLQEALGGAMVASFNGYVALGFFHPVVMLSLTCAAIYIATEPAGEVEDGLVDLVMARPVARHLAITRSAVVFAAITGTIVMLMILANQGAVAWLAPAGAPALSTRRFCMAALNLLAVVWCFGAAALVAAAFARRRIAAAGTVWLAAVVLYLLQFASAAWAPLRPVARVSPFHYYDALPTILGLTNAARDIGGLLVASVALFLCAQAVYARRDL